jgi:hypothetical protein
MFQCRIGFSPRCNRSLSRPLRRVPPFQCRIGFSPRCNAAGRGPARRAARVSMPDRLFSPLQRLPQGVSGVIRTVSMPDRLFSPLQRGCGDGYDPRDAVSMPDRLFSPLQLSIPRGRASAVVFQCRIGFSPRCNPPHAPAATTGLQCFNAGSAFLPAATAGRSAPPAGPAVSMPDRLFSPLQRRTWARAGVAYSQFQCRIGFSPRCNPTQDR